MIVISFEEENNQSRNTHFYIDVRTCVVYHPHLQETFSPSSISSKRNSSKTRVRSKADEEEKRWQAMNIKGDCASLDILKGAGSL